MWHNLQLGITAHNGSHDSNCARSFCQSHPGESSVAIWNELYFITMASDIDEGRLELHQGVEALVETARITAFQRWNKFETGERTPFAIQNVDDFHVMMIVL